jgi:hypothetical protein
MAFHPDREELAWAAGFFDGEGCFSYTERARYGVATIGQTDIRALERFRDAVGVGKIYGPYDYRYLGRMSKRPWWNYRAHRREHVQAITAMLWFKLGPIKREQALGVLQSYSNACRRGHPKLHTFAHCPQCVADAWAEKRRLRTSLGGKQLTLLDTAMLSENDRPLLQLAHENAASA